MSRSIGVVGASDAAVPSQVLRDLAIELRPGDVVTLDGPEVVYRWWRATMVGEREVDPKTSAGGRVSRVDVDVKVGDEVIAMQLDSELVIVDHWPGEPARLLAAMDELGDRIADETALFHHPAEDVPLDEDVVRRLLRAQLPQWADLPIERVEAWDNAVFRLGDSLSVRLPRGRWAIAQVEKEQRWLPVLAPQLPLRVPLPVALGAPGEGYPWAWSVYEWVEGERAEPGTITDGRAAALDLAGFLNALWAIDASDGPVSGAHNCWAGCGLDRRDPDVRRGIASVDDPSLRAELEARWPEARDASSWSGPPTWVHGDLHPNNVLARGGRLAAVIDFGVSGVGDPAGDLVSAWSLVRAEDRAAFRDALDIDDATWERGWWWAMSSRPSVVAEAVADLAV